MAGQPPSLRSFIFLLFQRQTLDTRTVCERETLPVKAARYHGNDLQSRLPQLDLIVQLCSAIASCIHFIYF